MEDRRRTISIADDDRARIPFAIVGVLLLLSSVTFVTVLSTRPDPDVNTDVSVVVDRTVSAAEGSLRRAATSAMRKAAANPMTVADNTPYGVAVAGGPPTLADSRRVFRRYVKLRVYRTARQRFDQIGQDVHGGPSTEVSLPPLDSPAAVQNAINSVTLHVGGDGLEQYGDPYGYNLSYGKVNVTIEGVQIDASKPGGSGPIVTQPISATVGSPLFQLHNRTEAYDRRLNTNFSEGDNYYGLGRVLGGRLYSLGYTRAYAQNQGEPVRHVFADRHVETMANDAIFAIQRRVFGNEDRHGNETLTRAYGCMLAKDEQRIYENQNGGSSSVSDVVNATAGSPFCDGTNNIYQQISGNPSLSGPPNWPELMNETEFLNQTRNVSLSEPANVTFGRTAVDDAVDDAIDRIYTINTSWDTDVEVTTSDGSPGQTNTELISRGVDVWDVEKVLRPGANDRVRDYYNVTVLFDGVYVRGGTVSQVLYNVTLTVKGEHSPNAKVQGRRMDYDYQYGPAASQGTIFGTNYEGITEEATVQTLSGVTNFNQLETQLENHILDETSSGGSVQPYSVLDAGDLIDVMTVDGGATVDVTPHDTERLRGYIVQNLTRLQGKVANVSKETERVAWINGSDPVERFSDAIQSNATYVYPGVGSIYRNAPEKARVEARMEMMQRLRDRVELLNRTHDGIKQDLNNTLGNATLQEVAAFTQRQTGSSPQTVQPADPPTRKLLTGMDVTVVAEPTYLTYETVDETEVPATGTPSYGFAPMAGREFSAYSIPSNTPGGRAVELATAGKVLDAAKLTDAVTSHPSWDSSKVTTLESSVDAEIQNIADRTGYIAQQPFGGLSASQISSALRAELQTLGPAETQAIMLGTNESVRERVVENVTEQFGPSVATDHDYYVWQFRPHLEASISYGLERSLEGSRLGTTPLSPITSQTSGAVRQQLERIGPDVLDDRIAEARSQGLSSTTLTTKGASWLNTTLKREPAPADYVPNRIPAGRDVLDEMSWRLLSTNVWRLDLHGEYERFSARASVGSPSRASRMEYVRRDHTVRLNISGSDVRLGRVEKMAFENEVPVLIGVPPSGLGVGDRTVTPADCSPTYDEVGPLSSTSGFEPCAVP